MSLLIWSHHVLVFGDSVFQTMRTIWTQILIWWSKTLTTISRDARKQLCAKCLLTWVCVWVCVCVCCMQILTQTMNVICAQERDRKKKAYEEWKRNQFKFWMLLSLACQKLGHAKFIFLFPAAHLFCQKWAFSCASLHVLLCAWQRRAPQEQDHFKNHPTFKSTWWKMSTSMKMVRSCWFGVVLLHSISSVHRITPDHAHRWELRRISTLKKCKKDLMPLTRLVALLERWRSEKSKIGQRWKDHQGWTRPSLQCVWQRGISDVFFCAGVFLMFSVIFCVPASYCDLWETG